MNKKLTALIAAATAAVMAFSSTASALPAGSCALIENILFSESSDTGFTVTELSDGTVAVIGCTLSGDVVIPDSVGEKTVSTIAADAFYGNTSVTRVVLPETVVSIRSNAFNGTTALTGLVIPAGVTDIASGSIGYNGLAKNEALKIFGYDGTAASAYASANLFAFVKISSTMNDIVISGDYLTSGIWCSNSSDAEGNPEVGDMFNASVLVDAQTAESVVWESEDETQMTAEALEATAYTGNALFENANAKIRIFSKGDGTCKLTAKTADGKIIKTVELTILQPAGYAEIEIDGEPLADTGYVYVDIGSTITLSSVLGIDSTINGGLHDDSTSWYSTDAVYTEGETTDDGDFAIKGLKVGSTTYSLTSESGRVTRSIIVIVLQKASKISILLNKADITNGGTQVVAAHAIALTAKLDPTTCTDTVIWETSNPNIATVSSTGAVTGLNAGTCTITARLADTPNDSTRHEMTASTEVTVIRNVAATELSFTDKPAGTVLSELNVLSGSVLSCGPLSTDEYYLNKTPANTTDVITWTSSNTAVATVDEKGEITAKAGGDTIITATAESGKSAQMTLHVKVSATRIAANFTSKTMPMGSAAELYAIMTPTSATEGVTWVSSDTDIAKIVLGADGKTYINTDTGKNKKGTVIITGTANLSGVQTTCTVTVVDAVHVSADAGIALTGSSQYPSYNGDDGLLHYVIAKNEIINFVAAMNPANATDKLQFTTIIPENDTQHFSVVLNSNSASLTGTSAGTTKLEVKTYYDSIKLTPDAAAASGYKYVFEPTVTYKTTIAVDVVIPCTSISFASDGVIVGAGTADKKLSAVISPSAYTDTISWQSENNEYVTVTSDGKITALKATSELEKGYVEVYCIASYSIGGETFERTRGKIKVTVTVPTHTVTVADGGGNAIPDGSTVYIVAGEKLTITGTGDVENTSDTFSVTSGTVSVASAVTDSAVKNVITSTLSALRTGQSIITVKASNGVQSTFTLFVYQPATAIQFSSTDVTVNLNTVKNLALTLPAGCNEPIIWSTADGSIISLTEKLSTTTKTAVSADILGLNTTTEPVAVTATTMFSGLSATVYVTVMAPAASITIDPAEVFVGKGTQYTIVPIVKSALDTVASTDKITWTSSAATVATVDENGVVTAIENGVSTITARTDSGKTARCKITVTTSITSAVIEAIPDQIFTGNEIKPNLTVKIGDVVLAATNYTKTYTENINIGTATVTVTGKGNFIGTLTKTFTIVPKAASTLSITLTPSTETYTGSALTPTVTVKNGATVLVAGTDYTAAYTNNIKVGTGTVTITGLGNYTGTAEKSFSIRSKSIAEMTAKLSATSYTYDGSAKKPTVTLTDGTKKLVLNTDYTVAYSKNTAAGTAAVTITGKGNYNGTLKTTFTIKTKSISTAKVTFASSSVIYTGKALTVKPTVKDGTKTLSASSDYTVTYSNNIKVGTATVTITGKGNYAGTLKKTFTIKLGAATAKVTAGSKKATISWSKVAGASGYQVYMSTSKSGTYTSIKTTTSLSFTKTGLKTGRTYYFKVRAYVTVNGKKVYGDYSTIVYKAVQ